MLLKKYRLNHEGVTTLHFIEQTLLSKATYKVVQIKVI